MKLSLAVIVKDEQRQVNNIISRYEKFFDELGFAVDSEQCYESLKKDWAGNKKVKIFKYDWCEEEKKRGFPNFDDKRNFLAGKLDCDYYFRLDTDDDIVNPQSIRDVVERAYDQCINIIYCWYDYARDQWGNVNAAHYRETIIKKTDNLYWNKHIHENVLPKSTANHKVVIEKSIIIKHNIDFKHAINSHKRNFKFLIEEYNKDKENTDPRTLAYLGRTLFNSGEFDKALFFLEKHIEKSGWDEDRYVSWCYISEILKQQGKHKDAIAAAFEAVQEQPEFPDAYIKLHDIYFDQKEWKKAIEWGKIGMSRPIPNTFVLLDPSNYSWRPALSMAFCYFQLQEFETAKRFFDIAEKAAPTLDFIVANKKQFEDAVMHRRFIDHFLWVFNYVKERDRSRLPFMLDAIPKDLDENEVIISIKNMYTEPKDWSDKSVVIFCGNTPDEWSAPSVIKGVGGSEEAVIYMSKELTKLGYDVTVYCNCGEMEGTYEGVNYLNWYKFTIKDNFNVLVSWRSNIFNYKINAKRKLIWLHDMPQAELFDKDNLNFDKVIVLSKYHKSLLPSFIPDDKIFISTNGINAKDFNPIKMVKRQKNRIIYASSYDRGLEDLLSIWGDVKKEIPDAELHIFYGWNTYDTYMEMGYRDSSFKDKMLELMKQDGVFEHGRVGHKQLLKEYAKSEVFAYPTNFAGEINCIALTKAIACGCIPITNSFAVLGERNTVGFVADGENFKKVLIEVLRRKGITHNVSDDYIARNSWETVARDWSDAIFGIESCRAA